MSRTLTMLAALVLCFGCSRALPQKANHSGEFILGAGSTGIVRISLEDYSSQVVYRASTGNGHDVGKTVFDSRTGDYYVTDFAERAVIRWRPKTGEKYCVWRFGSNKTPRRLAIAPEARKLYIVDGGWATLYEWDTMEEKLHVLFRDGPLAIHAVAPSAQGTVYMLRDSGLYQYKRPNEAWQQAEGDPWSFVSPLPGKQTRRDASRFQVGLPGRAAITVTTPRFAVDPILVDSETIAYVGLQRETLIGPDYGCYLYNFKTEEEHFLYDGELRELWHGSEAHPRE